MTTRDLNDVSVAQSISAAAAKTATVTGSSVDLRGYNSARVEFLTGVITDGSWLPSLEESDDDSTFTAVSSDDILGTLSAITAVSPEAAQQQSCRYRGTKRYIRAKYTLTATASPTLGGYLTAHVVRGHPDAVL